MYSIPQQAVTNGYWKIEYLRAQPTAAASLEVKKPGLSPETSAIRPLSAAASHPSPGENSPEDQYTVEVMALQALPETSRPRRQNFSVPVMSTMVMPGRTVVWQERTFSSRPAAVRSVTSQV